MNTTLAAIAVVMGLLLAFQVWTGLKIRRAILALLYISLAFMAEGLLAIAMYRQYLLNGG